MLLALLVLDALRPDITAQAQTSSLRWAGMVNEAFTFDGGQAWTVEGGGRIRHRDASGEWTFQATPTGVDSLLRRVFAREENDIVTAYAVGLDGWLLRKIGGAPWTVLHRQVETATGLAGWADLWDVHYVSSTIGYTLGLHGIWRVEGHSSGMWVAASFFNGSAPIDPAELELYAFDFAPDGTALACGQPGMIFRQRTTHPDEWDLVFDLNSMCSSGALPACVQDRVCTAGIPFEPWDLELSRHPTSPLALVVGGVGTGCGLVLASYDNGTNWALEPHECRCAFTGCTDCNGHIDYTDNGSSGETWRLRFFRELYNVSIFHGDNSAIASGYSGQLLVRDPDADPLTPGNQPLWRDRSEYSSRPLEATAAVTLPGFGVATNGGTASNGIGYATSMGGYIRRTTDGGQSWTLEAPPDNPVGAGPWRVQDVVFRDSLHGWMVSQFHYIARTANGGLTWMQDNSGAALNKPFLNAIALSGNGLIGVAVGQFESGASKFPTILFNEDLNDQGSAWAAPDESNLLPAEPDLHVPSQFRDVDWVGGEEFWAVGGAGLIFYSDPAVGIGLWRQFVPPNETYASFSDFDVDGVSFAPSGHGLVVGSRTPQGVQSARAYHCERTTEGVKWVEIAIPNEPNLIALTDVDFDGTTAYATGIRVVGGAKQGVVLKATLGSGVFSDFVAVAQTFDECTVGDAATTVAVLTEVEIAPGGAIWIGGQCGRLWRSVDGSTWNAVRSQTDAHVRGLSFPAADTGFAACHRQNRSGHSIVRIVP